MLHKTHRTVAEQLFDNCNHITTILTPIMNILSDIKIYYTQWRNQRSYLHIRTSDQNLLDLFFWNVEIS